ncbi:MAG TPA: glutamine amidotransferase [Patescibacteria group bacterium]|nr:glutamine amidotransferase [Patescibacteria group bacterium]
MRQLRIGYLYGSLMNLYGDRGNIMALLARSGWRDIEATVKEVSVGDQLKEGDFDLYFFGGGQDQAQDIVSDDLMSGKGEVLKSEVNRGVPILAICGGYQLLGEYYQPAQGKRIPGVGIFPSFTTSSNKRLVGNLSIDLNQELAAETGRKSLVGFENHSGQTYLRPGATPLGEVRVGHGNNGRDQTEGCVYRSAIGCYMHGSLLPKNPHLTDWLLTRALQTSGQDSYLGKLRDDIEWTAHQAAVKRAEERR